MARHHCQHLQADIEQFIQSTTETGGQKTMEVDRKGGQKTRDVILDMIIQNAKVTSTQMAESLGINRSAVSKHLKKMQENGIIKRVGPDKGGHWEIIEKDK
jgi:predicted HTH transcriptional regulator